ncbi:hypothetical protein ACFLYX_01270 [Chloroflexota bacterium]
MKNILSKKIMVLLGAMLLSLAVTGGLFAYTYTTTSTTISVSAATSDFGSVSANASPTQSALLGRVRGSIGTAHMFDVSTDSGYTGDVEVMVSLANPDELSADYSMWSIRLALTDSGTLKKDAEGITKVLSLANPLVTFPVDSANLTTTVYVYCEGGSYRALPFSLGSTGTAPLIFAQVVQASAH